MSQMIYGIQYINIVGRHIHLTFFYVSLYRIELRSIMEYYCVGRNVWSGRVEWNPRPCESEVTAGPPRPPAPRTPHPHPAASTCASAAVTPKPRTTIHNILRHHYKVMSCGSGTNAIMYLIKYISIPPYLNNILIVCGQGHSYHSIY